MNTPATDIITRLIGYAEHDYTCSWGKYRRDAETCSCGYSAAIAEARQFLEGDSDGKEHFWVSTKGSQ